MGGTRAITRTFPLSCSLLYPAPQRKDFPRLASRWHRINDLPRQRGYGSERAGSRPYLRRNIGLEPGAALANLEGTLTSRSTVVTSLLADQEVHAESKDRRNQIQEPNPRAEQQAEAPARSIQIVRHEYGPEDDDESIELEWQADSAIAPVGANPPCEEHPEDQCPQSFGAPRNFVANVTEPPALDCEQQGQPDEPGERTPSTRQGRNSTGFVDGGVDGGSYGLSIITSVGGADLYRLRSELPRRNRFRASGDSRHLDIAPLRILQDDAIAIMVLVCAAPDLPVRIERGNLTKPSGEHPGHPLSHSALGRNVEDSQIFRCGRWHDRMCSTVRELEVVPAPPRPSMTPSKPSWFSKLPTTRNPRP